MSELANTTAGGLIRLSSLAEEAKAYSMALAENTMQLGRVFCEAKELVKASRGSWAEWVETNTQMSERSAENLMAIYKRFSGRPAFDKLQKTQLFRMLSLPEGTEEKFVQEHDMQSLSTRQLQEEIRKAREEVNKAREEAKNARQEGRQEAIDEMMGQPSPEHEELQKALDKNRELQMELDAVNRKPPERTEIPESVQQEIERLKAVAQEAIDARNKAQFNNAMLMNQAQTDKDILEQTQEQLTQTQQKLLDLQSTIAKGDAERTPAESLDLDAFIRAVSEFIGKCSVMQNMQKKFSGMAQSDLNEYEIHLQTVERWCEGARKAMHSPVLEV